MYASYTFADLYLLQMNGKNNELVDVCNIMNNVFTNISELTFVTNNIDCQNSLDTNPSPPPSLCDTTLYCNISLHEGNRRKLNTFDANRIPCSVWNSKLCSSANAFLQAHDCESIENCAGCCLLDSPPPTIAPPPPSFISISPSTSPLRDMLPVWAIVVMISLIISGCALCTGVLIFGDCFNIVTIILNKLDQLVNRTNFKIMKIVDTNTNIQNITNNFNDLNTISISFPSPFTFFKRLYTDNNRSSNVPIQQEQKNTIEVTQTTTLNRRALPKSRADLRNGNYYY